MIMTITLIIIALVGIYGIWEFFFNPKHCSCGAIGMIEYSIYTPHSNDCPAYDPECDL